MTWRETFWFRIMFGSWGVCIPPNYSKRILQDRTQIGQLSTGFDDEEDTIPE